MTHSRRPMWRNGVFFVNATSERSFSESQGDTIPAVSSSPWGRPKNEDTACPRERIEAPLPPWQPRPACERLELPFSCAVFFRLRGSCLIRIGSIYHVE